MKLAFALAIRKAGLTKSAFHAALVDRGLSISEDQVYGWANLRQQDPAIPAYVLYAAAQVAAATVDELVAEVTDQPSPLRRMLDEAMGQLRRELREEIAGALAESRREMPPEELPEELPEED